jgi:MFS family permease
MLALLCVAQFIDVLGVTIVVVALPSLKHELGLGTEAVQWVVSMYALCFGGFLIVAGRAADIYGSRRVFAAGLSLFCLASLACGLAGSPGMLIGARALQGLGAALAVPAALALLTLTFIEPAERARALAVWTAAGAGGGAAGFVLGGLITSGPGWRWVFLVNVPIAAVSLALTPRLLEARPAPDRGGRLDLVGAVTLTGSLLAALFALAHREPAALGVSVALALVFVLVAGAHTDAVGGSALVPAAILRSRQVLAANGTALALTATTSAAAVLATVYAQQTLGLGATETGIAFLPFSLAVVAGAALSPWLARRMSLPAVMATGLLGVATAMLVLVATHSVAPLATAFALSGLSLGAAAVASTNLGTSAVDPERRGAVSGLLNTSTQLGTAIGVAVLSTVAAAATMRVAYAAAAAFSTAVALILLATRRPSRRTRTAPAAAASPLRAASRPPSPTARRTPPASAPPRSAPAQAWRGTSDRCGP